MPTAALLGNSIYNGSNHQGDPSPGSPKALLWGLTHAGHQQGPPGPVPEDLEVLLALTCSSVQREPSGRAA